MVVVALLGLAHPLERGIVTRARMNVVLATDDAHVCVHLQKRVIQILTTAVVRRTTVSFSPLG